MIQLAVIYSEILLHWPFPSSHGHSSGCKSLKVTLPYLGDVIQDEILDPRGELNHQAHSLATKYKMLDSAKAQPEGITGFVLSSNETIRRGVAHAARRVKKTGSKVVPRIYFLRNLEAFGPSKLGANQVGEGDQEAR